jgi:5-methylcytosine-specific restriction endonuclease McrA
MNQPTLFDTIQEVMCPGVSLGNGLRTYPHITSADNFHKNQSCCKDCKHEFNISSTKKINNDKRYNTPGWNDVYAQRYKEKKKGTPYDLTVTRLAVYLACLGLCHICEKFVPFESKWVMEHVDGNKGWTWDNIRIAHVHCNGRKHDRLMQELETLGILAEMRHPAYTKMMPLALTSGQ